MRYKIKIDDRWFEVEIDKLSARPIVATVEGETFEVWPAAGLAPTAPSASQAAPAVSEAAPPPAAPESAPASPEPSPAAAPASASAKAVRAPIPGVVVSIAVKPGDEVSAGQELCVLEAMKMNNPIRAPRAGTIETVYVSVGQHVAHNGRLIEYAD